MHAVAATGTPVVLVLLAGRPIGSPSVHEAAAAVLMAWLPGEQGGDAIARRAHRSRQPGRQAAGELPAQLRTDPGLLRPQGVGWPFALEGPVRRRVERAALPVRARAVVLLVHDRRPSVVDDRVRCRSTTSIEVAAVVTNTGYATRRRGRAAVRPRSGRVDHAAGSRAAGLPSGHARPGGVGAAWCSRCRSTALGFTGRELTYVVEPGDDRVLRRLLVRRPRAGRLGRRSQGDKPMPLVRSTTNRVVVSSLDLTMMYRSMIRSSRTDRHRR